MTVVLWKVPGAALVYWCNNGLFMILDISTVFSEALYSSWRGWARLLLHGLRNIAVNSPGPPKEFWEIVFILSMMSSLMIYMHEVFSCNIYDVFSCNV